MKKKKSLSWESKQEFKAVVHKYANKFDVSVRHVSMRHMTTKWASCSTTGYFTFNNQLIDMERKLGEYVILHELMHFHAPNHGKLWKSLMLVHMPDYEQVALRLKSSKPKVIAR